MRSKVWLVTSGQYSDYTVIVAFTTEAPAREFVAQHIEGDKRVYGDPYEVEEYPLLDAQPGPNRIIYRAQVTLIDGEVAEDRRSTFEVPDYQPVDASEQDHVGVDKRPPRPGISWTDGRMTQTAQPAVTVISARSPDRDRLEQLVRKAVTEQLAMAQQV